MNYPLNAKLLNEHIKKGWTATDFATYLGISDELFWDVLKKEFTRNAYEGFRSSLRKNEKYQKRLTKNSDLQTSETHEESIEEIHAEYQEVIVENTPTENASTEDAPTEDNTNSDIEITIENQQSEENTSSDNENISIEELEEKCQQSIDILNNLENRHKDLFSERCKIRNEISDHKEEFKKMLEEVSKRQQAIKTLQERFNSIGEKMEDITSQIRNTKLDIAQLTTQIEQAKKVYIYVCDSGEIVIESKIEFEVENWELLCYNTIVKENELKSLTIIQAEALAKAIMLVRFLIVQEIPYEIVFDSQIAETYFKKVIS